MQNKGFISLTPLLAILALGCLFVSLWDLKVGSPAVFEKANHAALRKVIVPAESCLMAVAKNINVDDIEIGEATDDTDNGCAQVTPVEAVERRFLALFFFCLCLYLFYGVAVKALCAGKLWRFVSICLLGSICFLLTIEFCDSASAFGCSGWKSIWRNFLCAYTAHDCKDNKNGDGQMFHDYLHRSHGKGWPWRRISVPQMEVGEPE